MTIGILTEWEAFAASWERLEPDLYLAEGHRYRRRRHASFALPHSGEPQLQAHRPHYQSPEYNPLYGGVMRWFEPIEPAIAGSACLQAILHYAGRIADALSPAVAAWDVEVHQFRIETHPGLVGQPTPEGMHRDGVDHVLVLLVRRCNVECGTTHIEDLAHHPLGSFTLSDPLDAAVVDDARVYHGVTPIVVLDPARPAFRDVLVVTLRAQRAPAPAAAP